MHGVPWYHYQLSELFCSLTCTPGIYISAQYYYSSYSLGIRLISLATPVPYGKPFVSKIIFYRLTIKTNKNSISEPHVLFLTISDDF